MWKVKVRQVDVGVNGKINTRGLTGHSLSECTIKTRDRRRWGGGIFIIASLCTADSTRLWLWWWLISSLAFQTFNYPSRPEHCLYFKIQFAFSVVIYSLNGSLSFPQSHSHYGKSYSSPIHIYRAMEEYVMYELYQFYQYIFLSQCFFFVHIVEGFHHIIFSCFNHAQPILIFIRISRLWPLGNGLPPKSGFTTKHILIVFKSLISQCTVTF